MSKLTKPLLRPQGIWRPIHSATARDLGIPSSSLRPGRGRTRADLSTGRMERTREVNVWELWLEVPLGEDWIAAYRLVSQKGVPVVGEVRVFPYDVLPFEGLEPGRERFGAGEWRGAFLGARSPVPPGGLTARLLRRVRVGDHLAHATQAIRHFQGVWGKADTLPEVAVPMADIEKAEKAGSGWPGWPSFASAKGLAPGKQPKGRTGRPRLPDAFLAQLANDYIAALDMRSRRPVVDVAVKRGFSTSKTRSAVWLARERGILSRSEVQQGKRGGALTAYGKQLIAAVSKPTKPKRKKKSRRRR